MSEEKINVESSSAAPAPELRMPTGAELLVSSSPHIRSGKGVRAIMLMVVLALLPAAVCGVCCFGFNGLRVLLFSVVFTLLAELVWCRMLGKPLNVVCDGSALVTGLLLGMNLPPTAAWWVCLLGAVIAIWLGKQIYGGLGHNLFNPVLVARVALLIALPGAMTSWSEPGAGFRTGDADVRMTGATPLGEAKMMRNTDPSGEAWSAATDGESLWNYFIGCQSGCVGETSAAALLAGGIFLIAVGVIKWTIPLSFIFTVAVITGTAHLLSPGLTPPALFHILTGGLMIGAFFMATDMVTSPITLIGGIIFGVGCGIITSVIRIFGNYPEGVSFSILFMNAAVPLIDRISAGRPFGFVKRKAGKEA